MKPSLLLQTTLLVCLLSAGIMQGTENIPANILETRGSGDLVLGVPSSAGLFGARGEVFYSVVANGVPREVIPATFTVIEIIDITRILAHVDHQSGEIQPGYSARILSPSSESVPPPATPTAGSPATPAAPAAETMPAPAAQAAPAASKAMTINQFLDDMVLVPDGRADIGVNKKDCRYWNETPAHKVGIQSFYIDKHEVTVQEYDEYLKDTGHAPPSHWKDGRPPAGTEHLPVVNVTYQDALDYCEWAHKRLPSEQEWEWAGRCGVYKFYPWGDSYVKRNANIEETDFKGPVPVGDMVKDISRFGVMDLSGNVSEWTASMYRQYPGNTHPEPEYQKDLRVVRGGNFSVEKKYSRLVFRSAVDPDYKACDLGFRTAIGQAELDELVRQGILRAEGE